MTRQFSLKGVCLLVCLSCCGVTLSWAAATGRSDRRASSLAVVDPCVPGVSTMQTNAMAGPSRDSASASASLLTRAKGEAGASLPEVERGNPLALELWASRISAPEANDDVRTRLALKRLIRRVQSLTHDSEEPVESPPPFPPAEPVAVTEPPTTSAATAAKTQPVRTKTAPVSVPETTAPPGFQGPDDNR